MTRHASDGCPRCIAAAERAHATRLAAAAKAVLAEGDAFFAAHPEVVTAAHAYAERTRQGGASS